MLKVLVDPHLPLKVRAKLELSPLEVLVPFSAVLPDITSVQHPVQRTQAVAVRVFLIASFVMFVIGVQGTSNGTLSPGLAGAGAVIFFVTFTAALLLKIPLKRIPPHVTEQDLPQVAVAYHRRYVVPESDLDEECLALWMREAGAANEILKSNVIRQGLIDSIQVAIILPYHLWEVTKRLALLSGPQREQGEIVRNLDAGDPDVKAILDPQQHAGQLAMGDIVARIKTLEDFASLTLKADSAMKRQKALEDLARLNPAYQEVLAHLGEDETELSGSGRIAAEVKSVADEADEAVRKANQAGRSLVIPWTTTS